MAAAFVLLCLSPCGAQEALEPVYRSPNHIRLSRDGRRAYVVNQDAGTISVLDVRRRKVLDEVSVGSSPVHAELSPDGRTLYVSRRYADDVAVLNLKKLRVTRLMRTGLEPYGLAVSKKGDRLFVANSMSDSVSIIDAATGKTLAEVPVGREPRYVAVTPDGKKLLVANSLSREITIVDVSAAKVVESRDLGKANILRQVAVSPDGRWGYVSHIVSHEERTTLQMERGWIHSNGFSVLDMRHKGRRVTLLLDRLLDGDANPWGALVSKDGGRLYVTLAGVHEVAIVDTRKALQLVRETPVDKVERLAQNVEIVEARGIARRVKAGGLGPRGLALSEKTGELLVANYFSDSVSVLDAETGALRAVIPLGPEQKMTQHRKGEMLFNDARFCFQRWFSCASCHQEDATVDGLSWDLPNDGVGNPKNVKSLHDVHDTAPAMWGGVRKDMHAAVAAGQRFLGFLPDEERHKALIAYINKPRRAPNPHRRRGDPESMRRGEKVYARALCDACHPSPSFTDRKKYDLGLSGPKDQRARFDTPSLREVYRTAPYLHDGSAKTLREVFTRYNPDGRHGRTQGLTDAEMKDLLLYLKSL